MSGGGYRSLEAHIGARVQLRRTILGLGQQELAKALTLPIQKVEKLERGMIRIDGAMLYDLSRVLQVPASFFFEDQTLAHGPSSERDFQPFKAPTPRDILEIVRALAVLSDAENQIVFDFVRAMVSARKIR
jgi:transcriptional regulator with XRE-family HTH domain